MSILERLYHRAPWRTRDQLRRLRVRSAYTVKRIAFALLRHLDPEAIPETVWDTKADSADARVVYVAKPQDLAHPPKVDRAIVINSDRAAVSTEALAFHLRGIFKTDEALKWAFSQFSRGYLGLTFQDIDDALERALLDQMRRDSSAGSFEMCQMFFAHKEMTERNRRAYSTSGLMNPNAVFWPDPTDPGNGRSLYTEAPFARKVGLIDRSTPIASAGSCFATEVAHALQRDGYNYIVKEQNKGKPGSYEFLDASEVPYSSAAWGVIFNTPSFRQLVEKAFEVRALPKILWTNEFQGKLRYRDPFRENIAYESPEAFEENYPEHIKAVREVFLEAEVLVITLGLNEVWYFKPDGSVFSRSPWRTAPSLVSHKTLTAEENVAELVRMTEILRAHNPKINIICTLSPIALHATFRGEHEHVVTANTHSKAVLRVAAEEYERRCSNVYYFPSYEVVTTSTEHPWAPDQRHVSRGAVENVMSLFYKMFLK